MYLLCATQLKLKFMVNFCVQYSAGADITEKHHHRAVRQSKCRDSHDGRHDDIVTLLPLILLESKYSAIKWLTKVVLLECLL